MATAKIYPGNCGYSTHVEATQDGDVVKLAISSDCSAIQKLAQELVEVNPYQEISFRRSMPHILQMGAKYCTHAACPVPVGIIRAVEVEAGLALPIDMTIQLSKSST